MDEVVKIAGSRDISKVDRDLGHLYLVGLLEKRTRGAALLPIDEANITPTSFGLELYARCNGHHGALQDFYTRRLHRRTRDRRSIAPPNAEPTAGESPLSGTPGR